MHNFLRSYTRHRHANTLLSLNPKHTCPAQRFSYLQAHRTAALSRLAGCVILALVLSACSSLPKNAQTEGRGKADAQASGSGHDLHKGITAQRSPQTDLLARIADGFVLPELKSEHVTEFERWSVKHPTYLHNLFTRAEPFLYYIVEQIEARGLPMELALLPAVESAYKTDAVSRSNAVGLWQFIASTGHEYGLKQDWWYDGRRDVIASTNAALDYLTVLHKRFDNDWFLALAAYNGGQGNLARSIKANQNNDLDTDYLALDLRLETRRYVPKLLALRNIVRNPDKYGVSLPSIPNRAAFARVPLNGQVDLTAVADQASLDAGQLKQLNAGFLRWATPPMSSSANRNGSISLLVPSTDAQVLAGVQYAITNTTTLNLAAHRVAPGDTLDRIARRYGVSVAALQQANNLPSTTIRLGHTLQVPVKSAGQIASTSNNTPSLTTASGNSTRSSNVSTTPTTAPQYASNQSQQASTGFALMRSAQAQTTSEPITQASAITNSDVLSAQNWIDHQVAKGETLWSIAQRYRVTVNQIVQWNKLSIERPLQLNQVLRVFL